MPEKRTRTGERHNGQKSDSKASKGQAPSKGIVPVVCLGASAGGLEALQEFFSNMPADSGMAFVVVTHQHVGHVSMMPGLLAKCTTMSVAKIEGSPRVVPNQVYVVPPGAYLAIRSGQLHLEKDDAEAPVRFPIDRFLRSLAQDQKELAVAIILSGTGTDGTEGIKEIKAAGGMVMVQEEESARYSGMPHSAIATGLVDYICPSADMARKLLSFVPGTASAADRPPELTVESADEEVLRTLFKLLHERAGHDFSRYKKSTIIRRLQRRMAFHQLDSVSEYVRCLETTPEEIESLFGELLIGVTSFFRDPEAFDALARAVDAALEQKARDGFLRVWVAGCSTGEEAYSLAILLWERLEAGEHTCHLQIFASDIDPRAIEIGRTGIYPGSIAADLSPERLERFFVRLDDDSYRVRKEIRETLIFAPQNLLQDPPFTKLDLISCRNLLIYLESELQQRVFPLFHYSLRPGGMLFLGSSESLGASSDLFVPLDKKWKIYKHKDRPEGRRIAPFPVEAASDAGKAVLPAASQAQPRKPRLSDSVKRFAEELFLRRLVPACALVYERGEIVHLHGRTGLFFEPPPGAPTNNIFNMAREGLELPLTSAFRQAAGGKAVSRGAVRVKSNGDYTSVDLKVERLQEPEPLAGLFLVTFNSPVPVSTPAERAPPASSEPPGRVADLENELTYTRESHQRTVQDLEETNQELTSSNEELQSTNEELQSANEELETSKEEMQSLNEELQTVNAEFKENMEALSHASDDMKNLLNGTNIATIFLDNRLCIKRFTQAATTVVRLIQADVGRPLGDLVIQLDYDRVAADAREVLNTLEKKEVEVFGIDQCWYLMRISPYWTSDNMIDGLVITFVDVTATRDAYRFADDIVQTVRSPILVLSDGMQVVSANRAFFATFGGEEDDVLAQDLFEIAGGIWDLPELRRLLNEVIPETKTIEDFCVRREIPEVGLVSIKIAARLLESRSRQNNRKILMVFDVSSGKEEAC